MGIIGSQESGKMNDFWKFKHKLKWWEIQSTQIILRRGGFQPKILIKNTALAIKDFIKNISKFCRNFNILN